MSDTPLDRVPGPDHRAGTETVQVADPDKISPKVIAGVAATIALTALATFLAAISPDMLTGLGAFAVPAALGIGALAQGISGYLKGDPARTGVARR
jgi:hypothetical protein